MVLDVLLDLVLPRDCSGCGTPGLVLCPACRELLAGQALGLVRPTPCPDGLPAVCAFLPYEGVTQRLLLAHKEKGRLALTRPLGVALAGAVLGLRPPAPVVLCPVPSSPAAVRLRGHDHAMRLASATAASLRTHGIAAESRRLLLTARAVADQSGLTSDARAANLRGALRAQGPPQRSVVIVDDVMTTGATLTEAARALGAAGHEVRGAVVLAATTRRSRHRSGGSSPRDRAWGLPSAADAASAPAPLHRS